ncbi:MAG: hypothetical protein CMB82_00740 [Flammeovirgaceae bacterium]|nr:hypothetical protein [Flammeovirgaceae bacterium]
MSLITVFQTILFSKKKKNYLIFLKRINTNVFPYGGKKVDGFHSELFLFKRISKLIINHFYH